MTPELRLKLVKQFALSEPDYREHRWRLGLLYAAQDKRELTAEEQIMLEHEQAAIAHDDALFANWKAQLIADGVDLADEALKDFRKDVLKKQQAARKTAVDLVKLNRAILAALKIVEMPKDEFEITFGDRENQDAHWRAQLIERERMAQHVEDALREDSPWVR